MSSAAADCLALSDGDDFVASAPTQFYLVMMGALVFFMQAGFSLLEAGSIGSTAVTSVLFKNMADVVVGAITWWAIGYAFAYGSADHKFIGDKKFFMMDMGRCEYSSWFFQWTFAATAVTIVSGAMAGRTQLKAYLCYAIFLTGFIYPVIVHWTWSGRAWLASGNENSEGVGYVDFAGSGIVHCTGGMAALIGAWMVGPRGTDIFEQGGKAEIDGHSMPLVQLGTMILFFGFIGFNGGSVLALDSATDGAIMSLAVVNTVMAAAGGGAAAEIFNWLIVGREYWSLMQMCNGVIAGMVAICASANNVFPWAALLIGFVGGIIYKLFSMAVYKVGIDDAIDAAAVHLGAGFWGVVAGAFFANPSAGSGGYSIFFPGDNDDLVGKQLGWAFLGLLVIMTWTGVLCYIMFFMLKRVGWLRVDDDVINKGLDLSEHGEAAYVFSEAPKAPNAGVVKNGAFGFQ